MFQRFYLSFGLILALTVLALGLCLVWGGFSRDTWPWLFPTAAAAGLALGAAAAIAFNYRVSSSLNEVTLGLQSIGMGLGGKKIFNDDPSPLGNLVRAFNLMATRLEERMELLERDRQQLLTMLSGMVEGVVALDNEQRILFVNERADSLLELSSAVGKRLWEVVRNPELRELAGQALEGKKPKLREISWPGEGKKRLTVHAARLEGARGAVLVIHDTTELRRLERLRQDFVANVSHELKTPLAVMKVCVETLLDGALDDQENAPHFLHRIQEQTERLNLLILDLLSLARIESGSELFEVAPVEVLQAAEQCVERHGDRARARGQKLVLQPMNGPLTPPPGLSALVDEESLLQILDNLVDNALKYSPEGKTIEVRYGVEGNQVILQVRDDGIGIPQEDLTRVFERFFRVDKARSRQLGGTGLGLAIVKHLVSAMKGTIRGESSPGHGSTFTVRLPMA
ncbi:MAG: PAS domain-containing sensor histidine kinase [Gemmataceae bacterium]|nr:PAS domain-containing sensor histidine kinase [Gemmataceae bacterium]